MIRYYLGQQYTVVSALVGWVLCYDTKGQENVLWHSQLLPTPWGKSS